MFITYYSIGLIMVIFDMIIKYMTGQYPYYNIFVNCLGHYLGALWWAVLIAFIHNLLLIMI
jgi:hypothetical protein